MPLCDSCNVSRIKIFVAIYGCNLNMKQSSATKRKYIIAVGIASILVGIVIGFLLIVWGTFLAERFRVTVVNFGTLFR